MEPYDLVRSNHTLPFNLYPFQVEVLNELAYLQRIGLWLDMGTGKTIVAITTALYKFLKGEIDSCVVLMPPVLLPNWARTIDSISGTSCVMYRGTPTQRAKIELDRQFTLMSYQIFCRDFAYLSQKFARRTPMLICDESTAVKNVATQTYKRVRDWSVDRPLALLSGSPLSSPADGYAPIKLISPMVYKTLAMFEDIHIEERDFFDKPTKWRNLDLLNSNLLLSSARILKTDVLKDLPPVSYQPVYYELDAHHMATYRQLVEEQILKFTDGTKLDKTNSSALFHALQQIPLNREVFTQEEGKASVGVELIEELLDELGTGKLIVFTLYRATNKMLSERLKKYGVVALYGDVSGTAQADNLDRFTSDSTCRVILIQLKAGGYGIDGLQHVCSDVLFAEMPIIPRDFHQAVARLWRVGQTSPVTVRIAIAEKTVQVRLWDILQEKDSLVNMCIRGFQDLRDALFGASAVSDQKQVISA